MDLPQEYYQQKKALLTQCLRLGEDIVSNLEQWELFPEILKEREIILNRLCELEARTTEETKNAVSYEKRRELDQSINLILEFDKNTVSLMRKEQQSIAASLKTNIQEQKTIQYGASSQLTSGRIMDYKK